MPSRIVFLWPELPAYGARCIRQVITQHDGPVHVIATKPSVPIKGMDDILGDDLTWIDRNDADVSWAGLGIEPPDLVFSGGYVTPPFVRLAKAARKTGAKVIMTADNLLTGSLRQRLLGPMRHRLLLRPWIDAVFVPGKAGTRWAKFMGYPADRIFEGIYGADPTLFQNGPALHERPKTFLYVGQFIDRKNVMRLARAFASVAGDLPDWQLRLCGSGPLKDALPRHSQIVVEDFVQPEQLCSLMQQSRCLVLPSLVEHWGLVVHEAALSGCALALSQGIGAGEDLATPDNARQFPADDSEAMAATLRQIAGWTDGEWKRAQAASVDRAGAFGPARFAEAVAEMDTVLMGQTS